MDGLNHNDISMKTLQICIVNAIKAIKSSEKSADEVTVYKFVKKELHFITNTDTSNTLKTLFKMERIEIKPSKDKSSYFLSDNNITDFEPHIPTIMATPLVETSSFINRSLLFQFFCLPVSIFCNDLGEFQWGYLFLVRLGSIPASLKILSFAGPFLVFHRFVEDWNNVLPKLPLNEWFRILVAASKFYFRQFTN